MIWRSLGRAGVVARLREQIRLANLLAVWIKEDDRFELSAQPSMGVICFRLELRRHRIGQEKRARARRLHWSSTN